MSHAECRMRTSSVRETPAPVFSGTFLLLGSAGDLAAFCCFIRLHGPICAGCVRVSGCPGVRVSGCPSVQASGCPTGAVLVASAPAWRSYGRDGAGRGRGGGGLWAGRMYKTRERRIKQKRLSIVDNLFSVSGRLDSNQRPPTPEAGALTGLRYTPNWARFIFKSAQRYV